MSADSPKTGEAKGWSAIVIALLSLVGTMYNTWTTHQTKQETQQFTVYKDLWTRANQQYDKYRESVDRHDQQNKQAASEQQGKYWVVSALNSCGKDIRVAAMYTSLDGANYGVGFYPIASGAARVLFYTRENELYLRAESEVDGTEVSGGPFLFDVRSDDGFHYVSDEAWKSRVFTPFGNWTRSGFKKVNFPRDAAFGNLTLPVCP